MKITIQTIQHESQRYPTVGDWLHDNDGDLFIKVSNLGDVRYENLVAIHELVEAVLCDVWGVTQSEVDKFDMEYEDNRLPDDDTEPGDSIIAPYHPYHVVSGIIERLVAHEMGVDWSDYEKAINKLG